MPRYFYKCKSCQVLLSIHHPMSVQAEDCSECGAENSLIKKPSFFSIDENQKTNCKVGDVVKKSISELKEELQQDKQELKENFYEPDK